MTKFNHILYVFSILIVACNSNGSSIQSNGGLVIVDSSGVKKDLLLYPNNHRGGYYPVYYMGKCNDTIRLGDQPISRYEFDSKRASQPEHLTAPDSIKMRIVVDTTFSLSHTELYETFDEKRQTSVVDSTKSYKATPIFIYNRSNSAILMGWANSICCMIRQIKNREGDWVDIEKPIDYYCLTSARTLIIKPKEMMVAKLLRHDGNIQVICRLKFTNFGGTVYSNSFVDFTDRLDLRETEPM